MIEIDGSRGEGGGQIVRTAVACAALRGEDVRIVGIRAARRNPGLAAQHVVAVRAVAALCSAEVDGLAVGASEVTVRPGAIAGGHFAFDVGTAGSVALVLQACLPVALAAADPVRLTLVGGTDVRWSPPWDYFVGVFVSGLRRLGADVEAVGRRRGYFPRGGGAVEVVARPASGYAPLAASEPGAVRAIRGIAHGTGLPEDVPRRMAGAARAALGHRSDVGIEERSTDARAARDKGGALVLWAETESTILGAACLAERGRTSERVGEEAAGELCADLDGGATLDVHAADQLLPYLALARGDSVFTVRESTGHLTTMAWLVPQLIPCEVSIEPLGRLWQVRVAPRRF